MKQGASFLLYRRMFSFFVLALLCGCTLAPNYQPPPLPVADKWPQRAGTQPLAFSGMAADVEWQEFFTDPTLQALIRTSLSNNRDLRIAALNIEAARARYQIQRATLFPSINATASGLGQRTSQPLRIPGQPAVTHQYSVGIGFSAYELDLFGRLRSLKDQALEDYLARLDTCRSTQISLIAEVANAWYILLAGQEQLLIAEQILQAREQLYGLTEGQFMLGTVAERELNQANALRQAARYDVATATSQLAQTEHGLTLLLGTPLPTELIAGATLHRQKELADLPVGLPSEILMRRPDILAAEHQLKAANANIGVARARFFPSISLIGTLGRASSNLTDLFEGGNGTWSFGPTVNLPIFDAGSRLADLAAAKVQRDVALTHYEKAIQTAFREVSDALAQRLAVEEQWEARQASLQATQRSVELSKRRYQAGVDSYLTFLDAQQSLYRAEQALVSSRLAKLAAQITVYKVLGGGGWQQILTTAG